MSPTGIHVKANRTSAIAFWNPHINNTSIQGYEIVLQKSTLGSLPSIYVTEAQSSSFSLNHLSPLTLYRLKIAAVYRDGAVTFGSPIAFTTEY